MLKSLKREYALIITSGAQLLLLFAGFKFESRAGWIGTLGLIAIISLFAWMSALRRYRLIRNTPTSHIGSAAQGYVELLGHGKALTDPPLLSKLSLLPCLWYRYQIEYRDSDNNWKIKDKGETDDPFILDDGSGRCVIDPSGAEILTTHKDTWMDGSLRFTEWKLIDLDTIYAIGQFRTHGGSSVQLEFNTEVRNVLAEWKENMPDLHRRFDLDGDGQLDMQEWMLARREAQREASRRMSEARNEPDINYLTCPNDGRLFLISNLPENKLAHRYGFWTWAHLVIFFGALGGISWILQQAAI